MTRKVLFIACFFPPVGGAGVQRAAKFVKYLPQYDWAPVVLTVQNPSVPVFDESLLLDVPESVPVYRARTWEPGYSAKQAVSDSGGDTRSRRGVAARLKGLVRSLAKIVLQPDPQVLWLPAACAMARRIFAEHEFDAIVATAPPFSSLLLGAILARRYNVPLLLDYRDEWDISNEVWENKKLGPVSRWVQGRMQRYALRRASAVTATTTMSTASLKAKLESIDSRAEARCIYNGYDSQDIEKAQNPGAPNPSRYLLSYVGTLWNLTSIEPIVEAVLRLQQRQPTLVRSLEIQLAGRCTPEQDAIVSRLGTTEVTLVRHAYLPHDAAISLMLRSQGLCLLLSDLEVARRVVPAKTFEYMTSGNSIFVVAPEGEVWELLRDYPGALCVEPGDVESLSELLAADITKFLDSPTRADIGFDHGRFERRVLTGELASLLNQLSGS